MKKIILFLLILLGITATTFAASKKNIILNKRTTTILATSEKKALFNEKRDLKITSNNLQKFKKDDWYIYAFITSCGSQVYVASNYELNDNQRVIMCIGFEVLC